MNEKNQMSIEQDKKIESSTSILLIFKNAIRKISKPMLLILVLTFFSVGFEYPILSETVEASSISDYSERNEYEKYVKLYEEIYERSLIQQIEFESEIMIPKHIDFKYVEYTYTIAQELAVPTRVAFRLMYKESSFKDNVKSSAGAHGLMQLMPVTREKFYKELRLDTLDLDKNQEDIYIGLYYIKYLENYWKSRGNLDKNLLKLSLAAYNAGPETVKKYKGIPPYKETQNFVSFILKPHSNPVFYENIIKKSILKDIS
jgi:hypothetical protein